MKLNLVRRIAASALGFALISAVVPAASAIGDPGAARPVSVESDAVAPLATSVCNTYVSPQGSSGTYWVPAYGSNRKCQLGMNNTGGGVAMLQWAVKKCNAKYNLGEVDGIYGGRTRDGVRAAQSHLGGLTLDGLYGPATHNKMRFYNAKGGCTADSAV